ncbi:MAG: polyketide cyclase [Anaerolineae bacterium]|nr:polyketide cyclase [Anaerolineae bacterium]
MSNNEYQFTTQWRVKSSVTELSELLGNAPDLVRWWPSVYLDVQQLEPGDERGIGRVIALYTKGWLPYTLNWQFRVSQSRHPYGYTIEAWGDFVGRGEWTFAPDGEYVIATYDWQIRVEKPLLRLLSPILKPVFAANHLWAMRMGEKSLQLELARRHAASPRDRAMVPAPPQPISPVPFYLGAAACLLLLIWLFRPRNIDTE